MRTREHLVWAGAVVASVALVGALANAGNLNPPSGSPASTMHSLSEVHDAAAVAAFGRAGAVPDPFGGPAYMTIRANGTDLPGEDIILAQTEVHQLFGFKQAVGYALGSTGQPSGARTYEPIVIRKRVDRATPDLVQALVQSHTIEAEFHFLRPHESGDGTTEHYLVIRVANGRILAHSIDTSESSNPLEPPTEEILITFRTISLEYLPTGGLFQDNI